MTLGPEGGAHQSIVTPSAGLGQPGCVYWEPAFAQDFEWCFLHAIGQLGATAAPPRISAFRPVPSIKRSRRCRTMTRGRAQRRRDALAGGYRLRASARPVESMICSAGAIVPEAIAAADELERGGIGADVICLTSPDLIFQALLARQGLGDGDFSILERLFPPDRPLPIVAAIDGHPHALAFLGQVGGVRCTSLGVTEFGQSGDIADLYRHHGIDAETIAGAALDLL